MWVIYANSEYRGYDYLCEDEVVYGAFNLCNSPKHAKLFKTKEEAESFADTLYNLDFRPGRNLFVAEITVNVNTTDYVGYFGSDLKRFG